MSLTIDFPAVAYVVALIGGFLALWAIKRLEQKRLTGVDPMVMGRVADPLQRYFAHMMIVLEGALVVLVVLHGLGLRNAWGFGRLALLGGSWVDALGLVIGLLGLTLCRVAQTTMRDSWRVGIDESCRTELVTTGVFRFVRNPTYAGLFALAFGLWLIWPTPSMATFGLLFCVLLEAQVRSEERHLLEQHGEQYQRYVESTKRYVPFLY